MVHERLGLSTFYSSSTACVVGCFFRVEGDEEEEQEEEKKNFNDWMSTTKGNEVINTLHYIFIGFQS